MRVLIAGCGVAALEAVLALRELAGDRVGLELLAPAIELQNRPASVRSPFGGEPAAAVPFDLTGVTHHRGALAAVDAGRREVSTTDGGRLPYDRLLIATGAGTAEAVHGATLFRGSAGAGAVEAALRAARERAVFALPAGTAWTLPAYELALLAARELRDGPDLTIVTPEARPLDIFGRTASRAVARLLDRAGIEFAGETTAAAVLGDALLTRDGRLLRTDAVIALPKLVPRDIPGLSPGFLTIDEHARVVGIPHVFAAGDVTDGPIKQGGLAAQQADAAAEQIAAEAGAAVDPRPYRPVLRGLLDTGAGPLYLSSPPCEKLAGRYITDYLASRGRSRRRAGMRAHSVVPSPGTDSTTSVP
jgi:sulfide:quinone oxidoreductase